MVVLSRYLISAALARIADEGARVSLVLLAVATLHSAALGGVLTAVLLLPHVVAAPLVGWLIDRARRPRRLLVGLVLVFAGSLLTVALLLGRAPIWFIVGVLLAGGSCGPAITGGLTSRLPGLVGARRTPRAFGLDSLFYNVAGMAGPAVAAVVATTVDARVAQAALAGCAVLGAAGIATLPIAAHGSPTSRPSLLGGAREIWRRPVLRTVTIGSAVGQLGPGALAVVAVVLAASLRHPADGGLLLTVVAAGSFVGSLLWTWHPLPSRWSALVTAVSMVGVGIPLALAALTSSLGVTSLLFGLSGVFIGPFSSALFTARTLYSTEDVRTQVFTIGAGLKVTASALGAALIGLATGLPVAVLLLLVAASPLLAGGVSIVLLSGVTDSFGTEHPLLGTEQSRPVHR